MAVDPGVVAVGVKRRAKTETLSWSTPAGITDQILEAENVNARREYKREVATKLVLADLVSVGAGIALSRWLFAEAFSARPILGHGIIGLFVVLSIYFLARSCSYSLTLLGRGAGLVWRPALAHFGATTAVCVLYMLLNGRDWWNRVTPADHSVMVPLLLTAVIAWAGSFAIRLWVRYRDASDIFVENTLIIGSGATVEFLTHALRGKPQVHVAKIVDPDTEEDLKRIVQERGIDVIVVATQNGMDEETYSAISLFSEWGIRVVRMAEYYEEWLHMVPVSYVNEGWRVYGFTHQAEPFQDCVQRLMDVMLGLVGMAVLVVLYVPIALAIKLTSKGPVVYSTEDPKFQRVGRMGRIFKIYKFRTMDSGATNKTVKIGEDDPRITKIGKILRRTKLDELPQMWNVLCGHMSLVGPRPICACEDQEMRQSVPLQHLRYVVRPGMTGLGQVYFGTAKLSNEHLARLQHDLYYIKHRSVALYLSIIAQTVFVCLGLQKRDMSLYPVEAQAGDGDMKSSEHAA